MTVGLDRFRLEFRTLQPLRRRPTGLDIRHLASYLFEEPQSATHHGDKPFSVCSPLDVVVDDDLTTAVRLDVGWLDPAFDPTERVLRACSESPDLGRGVPLRLEGWSRNRVSLSDARRARTTQAATLRFRSPTRIKHPSGRGDTRTPSAELVLRSVAKRHSRWVSPVPFEVAEAVETIRWSAAPCKGRGFQGDLELRLSDDSSVETGRWLTALLRFAELSGVGSGTRDGQGCVEVVESWPRPVGERTGAALRRPPRAASTRRAPIVLPALASRLTDRNNGRQFSSVAFGGSPA